MNDGAAEAGVLADLNLCEGAFPKLSRVCVIC